MHIENHRNTPLARLLLPRAMVVLDMDRIIIHIDFNSYFASVEQQANPLLRGKPLAVAGKGSAQAKAAGHDTADRTHRSVVTTASREAKARGVKTGMATWEARKLCPDLIVVPGDPHKYSTITQRFLAICKKHADAVELFSTDECFMDVTTSAQNYFGAVMIAQMLRAEIREACGTCCTVSIGIAPNTLVAKLASESIKPNGLTVVQPHEVCAFVRTRPLKDFCGLGPRIEKRLEALGVTSVDTLRTIPRAQLILLFKQYGEWLADAAQGRGSATLEDDTAPPKSIGHSYTFPSDLLTVDDVVKNLLALSDRVAWRMRRQSFSAMRVSAYVRYGDFGHNGGARLLGEPLTDGLAIAKNAWAILRPVIEITRGARLLGITVGELRPVSSQQSVFRKDTRMRHALAALDTVQARYGQGAWQRASTSQTLFRDRTSGWHYDHEL